jgi:hypothetical protein
VAFSALTCAGDQEVSVELPKPSVVVPALLGSAMSVVAVPLFVTGPAEEGLRVEWVNDAFVAATGVRASDLLDRPIGTLRSLLHDARDVEPLKAALHEGRALRATIRVLRTGGEVRWVQLSMTPVTDPTDPRIVAHWVGVQVDAPGPASDPADEVRAFEASRRRMARLDLMTQVSSLLTDLDHPQVLREIAEVLGQAAGCRIAFYMNDKSLVYAESVDVNTPPTSRPRHARAARPVSGERPWAHDVVRAVLEGEDVGPVDLDLCAEYRPGGPADSLVHDVRARVAEWGVDPKSISVYPVPGRRQVLGAMVVILENGREFTPSLTPGTTLRSVARRAGMLIDAARLYQREHRLAETLQRAMLPQQADVHGLDVWTYYAPNSEHAQVGGDWYDVVELTPGDVGVVIGDVVGHDVEAAATMGQMRSVVRSYAFEMTAPGDVLTRVDELVSGMRLPRASSLVYARLHDEGDHRWTLSYSRAGHLPPVLVRDGEASLLEGAAGTLVGYAPRRRTTETVELGHGDVVVFYTDGLIERRDRDLREGLASLGREAATVSAADAAGIGEQILARLGAGAEDDVAVVVVRVPDPQGTRGDAGPRSRRWVLANEPSSIARARHTVVHTCTAWGIVGGSNAELVVSELVANAVMHGWGHVALRLFDTADGLRIEVEDANPSPPVATDGHVNRGGGFGMQIVDRLADWGWRPTPSGKIVWAKVHRGSFASLAQAPGAADAAAGGPAAGAGPGSTTAPGV